MVEIPNRAPADWLTANQRHLAAATAVLRAGLEGHARRVKEAAKGSAGADQLGSDSQAQAASHEQAGAQALRRELEAARRDMPGPPALDQIRALFGLSAFEQDLLLLCAAVEFDASFGPLCAAVYGDPSRSYVTFGLALAALPGAHWSALAPSAPLRRWRLVEVGAGTSGTPLTSAPLRIDERALHFLAGVSHPDERLVGALEPVRPAAALAPSHQALAAQIAAIWSSGAGADAPAVQLCGPEDGGKASIAASACAALGLRLSVVAAGSIPMSPNDAWPFVRLWEREAALSRSALLLDCDALDRTDGNRAAAVQHVVERLSTPLFITCAERWRTLRRPTVVFDVAKPVTGEQRAAWEGALGQAAAQLNGQIDHLVSQFSLSMQAIREASVEALGRTAAGQDPDLAQALWDACRRRARPRLDDLAQRIEPAASWDDLVLPEAQRQILRDVAVHVRQRATVYERWGFAGKGARGLGISALFAGASGTGKTMAAEVLANALRLDLYRIDLSATVSKYIGETEKNLRRIFDAAEEGGAILLFDEADALFGKRSEVKDSHDRYANIEVGYLLQRMEAYRGLAILTTNMKNSLDQAFLRRIRFVVQFPFPDAAQRAEIWRRIFPASTPVDGLDPLALARLNVAGGNIRNIALNAAFLAADAGDPVRMRHILRAAQSEYAKLEKPLTDAEVGEWDSSMDAIDEHAGEDVQWVRS